MEITIRTARYDAGHFIMFVEQGAKDLGFELGICEFCSHMNWLLYDCKQTYIDGKMGFVFPDSENFEQIQAETRAFLARYDLDKVSKRE